MVFVPCRFESDQRHQIDLKWLRKVRKRIYNENIFFNLEGVIFLMKKTLEEKLQMCKEHVEEGKSLSHISELHDYRNIDEIKYTVNLYKRYGEILFLNREQNVYRRNTKLLAISRIKNGE